MGKLIEVLGLMLDYIVYVLEEVNLKRFINFLLSAPAFMVYEYVIR